MKNNKTVIKSMYMYINKCYKLIINVTLNFDSCNFSLHVSLMQKKKIQQKRLNAILSKSFIAKS